MRRYIRENGLVEVAGDRVTPDELLPLALHSIQELNYQVGEFFDRALFYLARGYEAESGNEPQAGRKGDSEPGYCYYSRHVDRAVAVALANREGRIFRVASVAD